VANARRTPNPKGNAIVRIDAPPAEGSQTLDAASLKSMIDKNETLSVRGGFAEVALRPETLKTLSREFGGGEGVLYISVKSSASITVPAKLIESKTNENLLKSAVDITITVNGNEIKNLGSPMTLTFDISAIDLTDIQKAKITAIEMLSRGKYGQIGGEISADGNYVVSYAVKPGQYSLIVSDTLVKITAAIDKKEYTVNGDAKIADVAPLLQNGRTMAPVRFIAEAFGADVGWDGDTSTVTIVLGEKTMKLTIGRLLPGMDAAPFLHEGRTMVPLRYIAENFDAYVLWNEDEREVTIYADFMPGAGGKK
jgi:hypothetical protein